MTQPTRAELLAAYTAGPAVVAAAVSAATTSGALDQRPGPGEWTPREIVHHLADSETMSTVRLRRLLAEDAPLIPAYDEAEWARRLHYDRPVAASLDLLAAVRAANAELLARLDAAEWARTGTHSDSGRYGVEQWLRIYAAHAHDHAEQIRTAWRAGAQ